jgi:glutamate dehydrogenase/leucine dehydrogenase
MKTLDQYRELIAQTERLQATHPLLYNMRVAAFMLAIKRVVDVIQLRGVYA